MTCESNGYAHNNGCMYTHGFFCEDCQTFLPDDEDEYRRYKLPFSL